MTCRLCKQNKELIKSHIIPKFFFKYLYPKKRIEGDALWLIDDTRVINKRVRVGPYEKLLCKECDNKFGYYDDYAKQVFIDQKPIYYSKTNEALLFTKIDHKRLKLFLLSMLWRASVSSLPFFSGVDLGPYEISIRDIILNENPQNYKDFLIFLTKYSAGELKRVANKNIQNPIAHRIKGINFCLFFLPKGYQVFIKVDRRKLPEPFEKIRLKDDNKMIVLSRGKYEKSNSFKALLNTITDLKS